MVTVAVTQGIPCTHGQTRLMLALCFSIRKIHIMTPLIADYLATLTPRAAGRIRGRARLDIADHGSVLLTETGAEASKPDAPADVVLGARDEVFRAILSGDQNPITAYMAGKLRVEGNVQRALKVSGILTGS